MKAIFPAIAVLSALLPLTSPVLADGANCRSIPRAEWRPMAAAVEAVKSKGYEIREIEIDDGCYEVKAFGKSGERIKLYLDPASLEIVRTRNRS